MSQFEYKVVPAPTKGLKAKGIKTAQDRFAHALEQTMNQMGTDGWEYQRTDTLPCEQRSGLTGKTTTFQHMLVFRRTIDSDASVLPVVAPIATTMTSEPEVVAPSVAQRTSETLVSTDAPAAVADLNQSEAAPRKEPQVAAE